MDFKLFTRNVSLYKLGIGDLVGDDKRIYDFLIENLYNLNTYTESNGDLDFGKDIDSIVLKYYPSTKKLYILGKYFFKFFDIDSSIGFDLVIIIIKWWVRLTLYINVDYLNYFYDYD